MLPTTTQGAAEASLPRELFSAQQAAVQPPGRAGFRQVSSSIDQSQFSTPVLTGPVGQDIQARAVQPVEGRQISSLPTPSWVEEPSQYYWPGIAQPTYPDVQSASFHEHQGIPQHYPSFPPPDPYSVYPSGSQAAPAESSSAFTSIRGFRGAGGSAKVEGDFKGS